MVSHHLQLIIFIQNSLQITIKLFSLLFLHILQINQPLRSLLLSTFINLYQHLLQILLPLIILILYLVAFLLPYFHHKLHIIQLLLQKCLLLKTPQLLDHLLLPLKSIQLLILFLYLVTEYLYKLFRLDFPFFSLIQFILRLHFFQNILQLIKPLPSDLKSPFSFICHFLIFLRLLIIKHRQFILISSVHILDIRIRPLMTMLLFRFLLPFLMHPIRLTFRLLQFLHLFIIHPCQLKCLFLVHVYV